MDTIIIFLDKGDVVMVKTRVKQVLAVAIAIILIVGTCFTGAMSVMADSLADGLTEVATSTTDGGNHQGFNGFRTITNISGGGITYTTEQHGSRSPYVHNVGVNSFPGTGVSLQFDNYTTTTTAAGYGHKSFMIVLSTMPGDTNNERTYYRLAENVAGIIVDTNNGDVNLVKGVDSTYISGHTVVQTIIDNNDVVKYASISGKPFTIEFNSASNGDIDVKLTVNGTSVATGTIIKAKYESISGRPTGKTYFSISSVEGYSNPVQQMSIDYYGYKVLSVGAITPPPSGNTGGLTDGLTEVATSTTDGGNHQGFNGFRTIADISGGGITYTTEQHGSRSPYVHKAGIDSFPGTGVSLQFDKYSTTTTASGYGYKSFMIVLSTMPGDANNERTYYRLAQNVAGIIVDTNNGDVNLVKGVDSTYISGHTVVQTIIDNNDVVKYASISGKPFTIEFNSASNGDIDVKLTVNGTSVATGTIIKAKYESISGRPTGKTYFSISSVEGYSNPVQQMSIDYYGYKVLSNGGVTPPAANPLIDGLTDIAEKSEDLETRTDLERTVNDLTDGGVSITWNKLSGYAPYRWNVNMGGFPGNGIKLQFANYKIKDTTSSTLAGYGQIVIALSSTTVNDATKISKETPFLQIDTVNGNLSLRYCNDYSFGTVSGFTDVQTLISNNDALKYQNFKEKPFSVTFKTAQNGIDYDVELDVNGTVLKSTIDGNKFGAIDCHPTPTSTYMSIGGIDNIGYNRNGWSIEYYGHKAYPVDRSSLINGLTEIATTAKNVEKRTDLGKYIDIEGGGVALDWQKLSGYGPYRFSPNLGAFPGDGLMLQFANYKINTIDESLNGYGQIVICLSKSTALDGTKIKTNVPFLQLDTVNGKVLLRVCNDDSFGTKQGFTDLQTVIDTNDTLKYENVKGKPFQIKFEMADNGVDYKLTVNIAGVAVTGTILKEKLDTCKDRPTDTATYISVGGIDNNSTNLNKWSIEFYGTKNYGILMEDTIVKGDVADVNVDIAALPATATLDDAAAILLAKAKYDALGDKKAVTDAAKLTRLMQELNALRQAAKYKPSSSYIAREPRYSTEFGNPGTRTVFSSVTDNGFKAEWRGAKYINGTLTSLGTQAVVGAYKLDGLRLFIDDFTFNATGASDFRIQFTSGDYTDLWDGTAEMASRMISVRMGMKEDKIEVNGLGMTQSWFAGLTSKMQRDNFAGKAMIVEWLKMSNGDYVCTITLDEEVIAFTVPKAKLDAMENFDENRVRIVIGTENVYNVFSMEVTGIDAKLDAASKAVMDKINALPTTITSAAQATAVDSVYKEYTALTTAQSEQVINNDKLTQARAAVRAFEGVDGDGRDADGYYVPSVDDRFGKNESNAVFASITESAYGGWHVDFNNGGYGIKNCFKQKFVMDDLKVRFDNFNYGHGSSFFVGFESGTSDCEIYSYDVEQTKYGIWLLVGYDSTIYSTNPAQGFEEMFPLFEKNEKLSATNLINKEFFMTWDENDDGSLTFIFTVDGTDFVYKYTAEQMERLSRFNSENVQIVIHNANGIKPPVRKAYLQSSVSVDITGVNYSLYSGSQKKRIQEIIDAIDALPETISYDIDDEVAAIRDMVFELDFIDLRRGITNYSKFVKIREALFDMHVADGTLYLKPEEDEEYEDDYEDDDGDDYDWSDYDEDYDDYDEDYVDVPEEEEDFKDESDKDTSTKKPTKIPKEEQQTFPWIIVVIATAVVALAIVIILVIRRKTAKEEK